VINNIRGREGCRDCHLTGLVGQYGRVVDVTLDVLPYDSAASEPFALVKLQGEEWELNIRAPLSDLVQLRDVRYADWASRNSLPIGTCAGADVHWAASEGQVAILIGHDDEIWDVAFIVAPAVTDEIVALAQHILAAP
jgi:hypothetical protein